MVDVAKYIEEYQPLNIKLGVLRQLIRHTRQDQHIERVRDAADKAWEYQCRKAPVDDARLHAHLAEGPHIGVYPMLPGTDVTQSAAYDLDDHDGTLDPQVMRDVACQLVAAAQAAGLRPMVVRSGGGRGIHIWFRWAEPQKAAAVRALLKRLIESNGYKDGTEGIAADQIEVFPKQDLVAAGGQGNGIALPFARESVPLNLDTLEETSTIEWMVSEPVPAPANGHDANGPDHDDGPLPVESLTEEQKEDARSALKYLSDQGHSDNYDEWVKTLLALQNADCGLELYHAFSRLSPKYDEAVAQKKWDANLGSAHSPWKTILARAKELGWVNPRSKEAKQGEPADWKGLQYIIKNRVVLTGEDQPPEFLLQDIALTGITTVVGYMGVGKTVSMLTLMLHVAGLIEVPGLPGSIRRKVLYLTEDDAQVRRLVVRWIKASIIDKPLSEVEEWFIPVRVTRRKPEEWKLTIQEFIAIEAAAHAGKAWWAVPVVVFDTGAASFNINKVEDNAEVSTLMSHLKLAAQIPGWPKLTVSILPVLHVPKHQRGSLAEEISAIGAQAWSADTGGTLIFSEDPNVNRRLMTLGKKRFDTAADIKQWTINSELLPPIEMKTAWAAQYPDLAVYRFVAPFPPRRSISR